MSRVESVWDYPRPPKMEHSNCHLVVILNGRIIADSSQSIRVLETSQPPTYYIPKEDVLYFDRFTRSAQSTVCEFKGNATYWNVKLNDNDIIQGAAWSYESPTQPYDKIKGYLAFYAGKMGQCYLDNELVQAQESNYYGGWVTDNIKGPFKLLPGTADSQWEPDSSNE